jgi:HTH-type transcriptional regulator / antitoxin HigA
MKNVVVEKAQNAWSEMAGLIYVPHTHQEYEQLVGLLDKLIDEAGEDESHPLASLMEVIGVLIEKYEDETIAELVA